MPRVYKVLREGQSGHIEHQGMAGHELDRSLGRAFLVIFKKDNDTVAEKHYYPVDQIARFHYEEQA